MRALKICLWIAGMLCLLSVFGMFLPLGVLESIARFFGDQTFPDSPLLLYAVRTVCATFVGVGVYFIILALRPMNYPVLVPFSGLVSVFIGVVCAITGPIVGMPVLWYLADSLSCLVLGILILVFWRQAKQVSGGLTDTTQSDRPE
ncbi:MAG: hypothetical protein ACYTEL_17045 [Planctomycetota bacterium]|jgi:hypothetical protein